MNKKALGEYADMKEEIKDLRARIDAGRSELERLNETVVTDSVVCGKKGKKPLRTVKVHGRPTMAIIRKQNTLERNIARLEQLELELLELQNQAEEYIEQIDKSELRIMFRLYYIDDLSYPNVALRMNQMFPKRKTKYTDENVKKRIQRYLEKIENVPQCPEKI